MRVGVQIDNRTYFKLIYTLLDAINKKRLPIFTVHVHPDGSRVATGGLGTFQVYPARTYVSKPILTYADAKVRIWATKPILRQEVEATATNKSLCTLGMHSGK